MMISSTSSGSFVHTWKEEGGHRGVGSSLPNKWQVNIIGTIIIIIVIIVIIVIITIIGTITGTIMNNNNIIIACHFFKITMLIIRTADG